MSVAADHVKRAFKYRLYPTDAQADELSRTFGCVNAWKKTGELAFLNDVLSVPLQRRLRHIQVAFTHFFGKRAKFSESLAIVWSRPLPDGVQPSTVTMSQDAAGRSFASLLCEDPDITPCPPRTQWSVSMWAWTTC